jgi:hypothetical protein
MATLFDCVFAASLDSDFNAPGYPPYNPSLSKRIYGRGIDGGYALTCSEGFFARPLCAPTTSLQNVSIRVQYGIFTAPSVQKEIIETYANNPDGSIDTTSFNSVLSINPDGSLHLAINSPTGASPLSVTSAAGVVAVTGAMHGIQLTFAFNGGFTNVTYAVVVNNVTVLSGTYTPPAGFTYQLPSHVPVGANQFALFADFPRSGNNSMISIPQVQVEDVAHTVSYPPCNALAASASSCTPINPTWRVTAQYLGTDQYCPSSDTGVLTLTH